MTLFNARCACALIAASAAGVLAQPQAVNRPAAARRVVAQFDFEPDAREVFDIPRYWDLAQDGSKMAGSRPGFPAWNSAAFDPATAFAGSRSVRLTTRGGSTCLRVEPGVIPVFPGTDYLVSARIRTSGLTNARATITARYLDKLNTVISSSEARAELIKSDKDEWQLVTVPLSGDFPAAAYVQIDLNLLQPDQFGAPGDNKHQVWPQDFAGNAWFDQVAVVQLPRATIATSSPTNIIRAPERPRVSVMLRDLTGEQITGNFALQDASGAVIDSQSRNLGGGAAMLEWSPKVDRFGWYRATLELRTNQRRVGATYVDLAWLPPAASAAAKGDAARFGVMVESLPQSQSSLLPDLVQFSGAGAVTIPVWSAATTPADVERLCHELIPVVERLRASGRRITFSLPRIPDALAVATRLGVDAPLSLFPGDDKLWGPYLNPLLDKYGQGVQRWQIGSLTADPRGASPDPARFAGLSSILSKLVPGPVVEVPWPADLVTIPFPGVDTELLAMVPGGVSESGLTDLASAWAAGTGPAATMVLSSLPPTEYTRLDSCIALVKQAVQLWAARDGVNPPSLAITQPWEWASIWRSDSPMPRAELAAWSNLTERLRDRRAAGRLSPRPGVCCTILAGPAGPTGARSGALALWSDAPAEPDASIDLYLGEEPVRVIDIFGNTTLIEPHPITSVAPASNDRAARPAMAHRLPVSEAPVFIEGVDVDLAVFAASFKLDPPFAASSSSEHQINMILTNPWKNRIEGRITVLEPGGLSTDASKRDRSWRITPRASTFTIGPSETVKTPLLIAFSAVEEAGPKDFLVEIELTGTKDYAPLRLHSTLEIGINDFHLDLGYRIVNGADVAVEAQVINRGKGPANYEVNGFADGYPRAKAYISDLPPGAMATRRLSFPGGASRLKGQRISVGVQDVSTQSRLTRSIQVE